MSTAVTTIMNEVHALLEREASDEAALLNGLGALCNKYGDGAVNYAIIRCMRIAYLRLQYSPRRS